MSESISDSVDPTPTAPVETTDRPNTLLTPAPEASTEVEKTEDSTEGDETKEDEAKVEGAPEQYEDFTAPEGVELIPAVVDAAREVFKEVNLSQEAAQKVLDKLAPIVAAEHEAQLEAEIAQQAADWEKATRTDKEIGGEKLAEVLANGQRVLDAFDKSGELTDMLSTSGLGNHPAVIKFMNSVYAKISPDTFVKGDRNPKEAKPMYPNSNMVR